MKRAVFIVTLLLAWLKGASASAEPRDSLVLMRVFNYMDTYSDSLRPFTTNYYLKHFFKTHRRNFTLWVVPSMYAIARGQRDFVSEQYGQLSFDGDHDYRTRRQVYFTTVPHHSSLLPTLAEFLTPNLYGNTLYGNHILSPFRRANRIYYKYRVEPESAERVSLSFRPRFVNNTQLVRGHAIVNPETGRILETEFNGEYDMIRFRSLTLLPQDSTNTLLPSLNKTDVDFKFLGNHVSSSLEAMMGCPATLPEGTNVRDDRHFIDSIRPYALTPDERAIYDRDRPVAPPKPVEETKPPVEEVHHTNRRVGWEDVGKSLIESLRTRSKKGYLKLSPIINPQYIGYSKHKGFSYQFRLGAEYKFNDYCNLTFNPRVGYNFKKVTFYYNAPLRLNVWPRHKMHLDVQWGNGNRIGSSAVMKEIRELTNDDPDIMAMELHMFNDRYMMFTGTAQVAPWLGVEAGMVNHIRKAVNVREMRKLEQREEYRTTAPRVSLKLRPLKHGPMLTIDWERGLETQKYDIGYERWELDAQMMHTMSRMQTLNMRIGGGFYTEKESAHFMDYSNFRDQNLPGGWNDDWSGNFQLLSSEWYNASPYYLRGNVSFESPLLAVSFMPLVGRFVERERIYISSLSIANTRLYSELGYGFTCRIFSVGLFASFLNTHYQAIDAKFTFELFRRW